MTPTRRTFAASLAAVALAAPALAAAQALSPADQALVAKAQTYLEGLNRVKGRFTQTDSRGATSGGELTIQRPGKARFAFDPPSGMLIVSDGRLVSVWDPRLKSFNNYPLGSTPLSLFLAKDIKLQNGVAITRVTRFPNGFVITAQDGRRQTRGWITLTFADNPMRLTEWTVTDAQGARTEVKLGPLQTVGALDPKLFVIRNPLRATGG
jgi:outer membrane lipoprotein-sorting protein